MFKEGVDALYVVCCHLVVVPQAVECRQQKNRFPHSNNKINNLLFSQ